MREPPRGMYSSRVDEKGRLKLPADFQQYFGALMEKKLFVTSLDRRTAQVYTLKEWRHNEEFLLNYGDDVDLANAVSFNSADLGSETEMDGQGRILFSPELRRELGIENQAVRIFTHRGHIEVLSEATYEQRKREASSAAVSLRKLEASGLK